MTDTPHYAAAYGSLRARVAELVTRATPAQLTTHPPATPNWTVHDVLAHLVGVTGDILGGVADGIATDAWTQAQVDARRERSVDGLLTEWTENSAQVEPMIPAFGPMAGQFIGDAATHEHDIRGALDTPGARDSDAVAIGFEWLADRAGDARDHAGVGSLQIHTEVGEFTFGTGAPTASTTATRFEVMRTTTGRRSLGQIDAWGWQGDVQPELLVLSIFRPRTEPLVE